MKGLSGKLVASLLLTLGGAATAQEPDFPPGAKSIVRDLLFKIENVGGEVTALEVKESAVEVRIELAADVLFDFDKATLLPKAEDTLRKAAAIIQERATGTVRIEGHTDSKGDNTYNQRLSERRAVSVHRWFAGNGLGGLKFSVSGFGETRPVAPNNRPDGADDPEGRQKNRRVEIVMAKKS